ncbi:helix-turn-helix domain-containing protein [uncultured Mucilaginibacter sp.]|uniref:helix-turn-helix domain-containing protein n=1 Tax=uncultured Mucilaginibacter sp. TaxID=797541 RepID=UPI0025F73D5D|nr:helix-turn-helix domain-containing protein [uncultured Mucilaginibacter sp.]
MDLPQTILTRKDEITRDFLALYEDHVSKLMSGEHRKRYAAKTFANLLFIDSRHLTNTLKLTTGRSPCDYMEQRIVNEAKKLLAESDLSVAQIGYKFAYDDPTNFTKFFKGMTGITPRQYRKQKLSSAL